MKISHIIFLACMALLAGSAQAATFTVSNTNDAGINSLRRAISDANATAGPDFIIFSLASGAHTITLTTGEIDITDDVTIDPTDDLDITVDGNNASRVFHITDSGAGSVTLSRLRIQNGLQGVEVNGNGTRAIFQRCQFFQNDSGTANGGGLSVGNIGASVFGPEVIVNDCGFRANNGHLGGAANLHNGTISFRGCTFYLNESTALGGAVRVGDNNTVAGVSTATFTNCTFSDNTAGTSGGALSVVDQGAAELKHCTITDNTSVSGAAVNVSASFGGASVAVQNTVIADNNCPDGDVSGTFTNLGHNFIGAGDNSSSFVDGVDDCTVGAISAPEDPMLSVIGDFGGLTVVHSPLGGSPLIDAGDNSPIMVPPYIGTPEQDQLGLDRIVGGTTDIGSVEFVDSIVVDTVDASGPGSLLEAITAANLTGGKTIRFSALLFNDAELTIPVNSEFAITDSVRILGPRGSVILDGQGSGRIFNITSSGSGVVELKGLRIVDGDTASEGGGVRITGSGTEVLVRNCGISGNHTDGLGGGVYLRSGTLTVLNSTVSENTADQNGGGIQCNTAATLNVLQSTISGNSAVNNGGGLFILGGLTNATLINCTIAENEADTDANGIGNGGGIRRASGSVTVGNCIIAKNTDSSTIAIDVNDDVSGSFTTLGHNLIGKSNGSSGFADGVSGDIVGNAGSPKAPGIGSLSVNGGDTRTHAPNNISLTRGAGDDSLLSHVAWPGGAPTSDQRGQFRIVGSSSDIGSVEWPSGYLVRIEATDATVNEWGSDTATVLITRGDTSGDLDVELQIGAASVADGSDLVSGDSTFNVTFPDGVGAINYNFNAAADKIDEPDELLRIALVSSPDYIIEPGFNTADITIVDTDFVVTSTANSGPGTLRDQKIAAEAAGGGNIVIEEGLGPILLGSKIVFTQAVTVEGNGATVDGQGSGRVLEITAIDTGCVKLKNLIITGGQSTSVVGPGIRLEHGACLEMVGCTVTDNHTIHGGGGIGGFESDVLIRDCSIHGNTSGARGGGINLTDGSNLTIVNTTIANNTCEIGGGGVFVGDSTTVLVNNNITGNTCDSEANGSGDGGGISSSSPISTTLANNIIAGNFDTPNNGGSGAIRPDVTGAFTTLGGNLIGNNSGEGVTFPAGTPNAKDDHVGNPAGPIDPLLTPVGSGVAPLYYTFDLDSEAFGNGDDAHVTPELFGDDPTDQRGLPRIDNLSVDIGAVEMDYLVVIDSSDSGFGTLRNRLSAANNRGHGTIIFSDTVFTADTTITLTTGQLEMTGDGAITVCGREDIRITIDANNASRVMQMLPTFGSTGCYTLKDLDLINGDAGSESVTHGGGIFIDQGPKVNIECCLIQGCSAPTAGGGVSLGALGNGGATPLTMTDCIIRDNSAPAGGGLDNIISTVILERCTFRANSATETVAGTFGNGAGVRNLLFFTATNCTFSGNEADNTGGGLHNQTSNAVANLLNCTFKDNRSDDDASGTSPSNGGGGIRNDPGATVNIQNTVVADNSDGISALVGQVFGTFNSLGNNFISQVAPGGSGFASGMSDQFAVVAPLDAKLGSVELVGKTGTHPPLAGSPLVGAGNSSAPGLPATDQTGNPRIDGVVDIGSVEIQRETVSTNVLPAVASERLAGQAQSPGVIALTVSGTPTGAETLTLERVPSESTTAFGEFNISSTDSDVAVNGDTITVSNFTSAPTILFVPIDDSIVEGPEKLTVRVADSAFFESLDDLRPGDFIPVLDNDINVTSLSDLGPGSLREAISTLEGGGGGSIYIEGFQVTRILSFSEFAFDGVRIEICAGSEFGSTIEGRGNHRLFDVGASAQLLLKGLNLTAGDSLLNGGAIFTAGDLEIEDCAIYGNYSTAYGGGIYGDVGSTVDISNTTISGNTSGRGGGLALYGTSNLRNVTITDNTGTSVTGGLVAAGTVQLRNVLIAGNDSTVTPDISGTVTSGGGNVIGVATGAGGFTDPTDQTGTDVAPLDAKLSPLARLGGPTRTHALWIDSPAIDAGVNVNLATDQRGLARSFNGAIDCGAYEHQYVTYTYWARYSTQGVVDDPDEDIDLDGVSNAIEFICDTDPLDPLSLPVIDVNKTTSGMNIEIPRNEIIDPADIAPMWSEDLQVWDDTDIVHIEFDANGNNTRRVRYSRATTGFDRMFMRFDFIGETEEQ